MNSALVRQLVGCVGTLLCISSLSPVALALQLAQQPPAVQCNVPKNTITQTSVQEWIERSRTLSQNGRPKEGAQALLRALQLTQRLSDMRLKADTLRLILEENPTGALQELVDRAIAKQQPEAALSVLPLTLEIAQSLQTAYSSAKTQAMTAVAKHYIALNQPQRATGALTQALQASSFLQGADFKTKALTAIAQRYASLGNRSQTITLLDQSLQFAEQVQVPNQLRRAWLLQPIALTYAKAGAFEPALWVAQMIPATDEATVYSRNEAIAGIAQEYARANQIDQAVQLIGRITHNEIKARALARMGGAFQRAGGPQQAQAMLNQAIAIAQAEPNRERQSSVLAQVATQYAQSSGYVSGALPTVNLITDQRTKAQTLVDLATLETNTNQATTLIAQALSVAQQIQDGNSRTILINSLIESHLSARRFGIALQIAQSLNAEDSSIDKPSVLWRIAQQAAAVGEFDITLKATEAIPATWIDYRHQGFRDVAVGYAQAGQYDRAMQLVQRIDNSGSLPYQVRTLVAVAEHATKRGDTTRANALLEQALQVTNRFDNPNQKSDGLTAIAIQMARMGQASRAAQLRSQAIQVAQSSQDVSNRAYQLRQMVEQYGNAQQYEYAVQTAQMIQDEAERNRTLNEIATKLIEAEQFNTAIQAANALSQPADRTRFLVDVASHFVASGRFEEANRTLAQAFEVAKTIPGAESKMVNVRRDLKVDDPYDRGSMLEAIALKYATLGQYNRAVQVAQTLQTSSTRNQLMQQLACYR